MRTLLSAVTGLLGSILLASTAASAQTSAPYPTSPTSPPSGPPPYPPNYQPPPAAPYPGYAPAPVAPGARLRYREGVPPPPGYHLEESPRKGLVISGAVVLGATWVLSAAIGSASTNAADRWLFLPVIGPFADLVARGSRSCTGTSDTVDCSLDSVVRFYLAMDGIIQTAGGVLLVLGFAFPKKEYVSDSYYGMNERGPRIQSWTVTPQLGRGSRFGLALTGEIF